MKFQLSPFLSDFFIGIYLLATLLLRFYVEPQLGGNTLASMILGALALLFLWAMIKSNFLQPNFFGLLKKAESN